jgi:glyoxylase-like metal-dependent hydrolase (beta-lactamase superfamily II)
MKKPKGDIMQVADGVYRLTRGVTNFYLIEEGDKLVLVDAGVPKDWDVFTQKVGDLGHRLNDLEAVLLTHAHADHTGFAEKARTETEARVWIHEDDEHSVTTGEVEKPDGHMRSYLFKPQMYRTMLSLGRRGAARIIPVHEVSSFSDGEVLDLPGKPRVIHAPGHTKGSCALLTETNHTLFAGDVLMTWNPLTGESGPQIMPSGMNQDSEQAMRSLDEFDGISADALLPGHGDPWVGGVKEAVRLARTVGIR